MSKLTTREAYLAKLIREGMTSLNESDLDTIEQALMKYAKMCDVINQLTDMICIHKIYMSESAQEALCRNFLELIYNRYEVKEDE